MLLGILLLFFIGKYFYKLAEEYDKNKWLFGLLGIVSYYTGTILSGFILGFAIEIISPGYINNFNDVTIGLLTIPFGLLTCYILYHYLEKKWKREVPDKDDFINQIGKKE